MAECQCMYVVVQDPSLVIRTSHECLGLFLPGDIEGLVVDTLEDAFDHHIARYFLCCVIHYMLLINQAVHLRSQSHQLRDAMSVVFVLKDGTRQLLVAVEERFQ